MVEITLYTSSGIHIVTTVMVAAFQLWPEILVWGERFFVLQEQPEHGAPPRYHEGLAYFVPPPVTE